MIIRENNVDTNNILIRLKFDKLSLKIYKSLFSTHCASGTTHFFFFFKTLPKSLHELHQPGFTEEGLRKLSTVTQLKNNATEILNYIYQPLAQPSAKHTAGSC